MNDSLNIQDEVIVDSSPADVVETPVTETRQKKRYKNKRKPTKIEQEGFADPTQQKIFEAISKCGYSIYMPSEGLIDLLSVTLGNTPWKIKLGKKRNESNAPTFLNFELDTRVAPKSVVRRYNEEKSRAVADMLIRSFKNAVSSAASTDGDVELPSEDVLENFMVALIRDFSQEEQRQPHEVNFNIRDISNIVVGFNKHKFIMLEVNSAKTFVEVVNSVTKLVEAIPELEFNTNYRVYMYNKLASIVRVACTEFLKDDQPASDEMLDALVDKYQ